MIGEGSGAGKGGIGIGASCTRNAGRRWWGWLGRVGGGGGGYSFFACLSHLTIDHASLSRRSTVPTPNRDTSNVWALITLLPYIA